MIASHESNFRAQASNPLSSATGLYQIIKKTWQGLVSQGKIIGVSNNDPDLRINPLYNAYGGAAYMRDNIRAVGSTNIEDLYLAHFMGTDGAKRVIVADSATGGHAKLSTVMSAKQFAATQAANPTVVHSNTTVGEMKTWAATKMANRLIKGVGPAAASAGPANTTGTASPTGTPPPVARTGGESLAKSQGPATTQPSANPCADSNNKQS